MKATKGTPAKRQSAGGKAKSTTARRRKRDPFQRSEADNPLARAEDRLHVFGDGQVCLTNARGYPSPENRSPAEIVLDATEGFVPLWAEGVTLMWRFNEASMSQFRDPDEAKREIRSLWGDALLAWGDAAPVKFKETADVWDFELVVRASDSCSPGGCTLARAFFPDAGRHELVVFPRMFAQSRKEQVDTFIHELGHIFGLRHFFANVSESAWPSVIFGTHHPFSIMNYGHQSELTDADRSDLRTLYREVWEGSRISINGTPIVAVRPYHELSPRRRGV